MLKTLCSRGALARCLFFVGLSACAPETIPATEALVAVHSDLEIGVDIERIHVQVHYEESDSITEHTFEVARAPVAREVKLPFSFGVSGAEERILLVVTGYGPDAATVIEHRVYAQLEHQQTLLLEVYLARACLGAPSCGEGQTCRAVGDESGPAGECADIAEPKLFPVVPGQEFDEWEPPPDYSPTDGGAGAEGTGSDSGTGTEGFPLSDAGVAYAVSEVGQSCPESGMLACAAPNSTTKLICSRDRTWTFNGSCENGTRCDTRVLETQGRCLQVVEACSARSPDDSLCAPGRKVCGRDLLDLVDRPCPEGTSCVDTEAGATCE